MNTIRNIRNLYTPIQPSVRRTSDSVLYREYAPHPELSPFIYCYWELKTEYRLKDSFTYRVVSDGCIDIFFNVHNTRDSYVMGFCKKYTEFPLEKKFHYFGIRFLPTIFPQVFKLSALELSNKFQELEQVNIQTSQFIENEIDSTRKSTEIIGILNEYFIEIIPAVDFDDDSRLYLALDHILKNHGMTNIEADINTGISHRQLRRVYKYYLGTTPKTFCKVVRFQHILRAKPSKQSLRQNKLFYDLGYFDQAHFIKDFRNFYGVTPAKAFGRE